MVNHQGTLTIQFKKNKKGNLKRKNISISSISLNNNQNYHFDQLPDKNLPESHIAVALLTAIAAVIEEGRRSWEVEFDLNDQQIFRLRERGQNWDREEVTVVNIIPERVRPKDTPKTVNPQNFHNPYNFVPALPRNKLPKFNPDEPKRELGDAPPIGHGRYFEHYWSGRISVKLTTVTPLLIPDAAEMTEDHNGHRTYPMRLGADGKPYLPSTSIKGMLRSAYEAVTNSRLSVFEKHDARLAYRMPATEGTTAKPARVEQRQDGLYLRILEEPKSSCVGGAAKLRRYSARGHTLDKGEGNFALKYPVTKALPQHGDRVRIKLSKGKVTHIELWEDDRPLDNDWKLGWVCVTGANISNKQNERVFIQHNRDPVVRVTPDISELWENLIADYQKIHQKDLENREHNRQSPSNYLGHKPGKTAWSRHIYEPNQRKLDEGILCYVELDNDCDLNALRPSDVIALQPVTISRRLYTKKPADLLPESLHPAVNIAELSPADRVFGWVNKDGKGSYKGQLRVHSVTCISDVNDAINDFGSEEAIVPLAILGQPKPQQARFYCADDQDGNPLADGVDKREGYRYDDQGLRGRKVYPHHQGLPINYWDNPTVDRTQDPLINSHYQEYRRPRKEGVDQDDQNRSIKNWIQPGTEFKFDIDVINLSSVELGALLWLLSSPDIHYHRLGGGKPLGFGSVWLNIDWKETDLRQGADWKAFYQSLASAQIINSHALTCMEDYKKAVVTVYGANKKFEQIPFITAFCRSTKGFDDNAAIHYPRSTPEPTPDGKAFEWFVNNEQDTKNERALKLALPSLAAIQPLNLKLHPKKPAR